MEQIGNAKQPECGYQVQEIREVHALFAIDVLRPRRVLPG